MLHTQHIVAIDPMSSTTFGEVLFDDVKFQINGNLSSMFFWAKGKLHK